MNQWKNLTKGFFRESPTFALFLGMCPVLGVTTSASNGLGMGLATTFVLVMSNVFVSLIKSVIPDKVRIPAYIVLIASFVTIVELVMQAYVPDLFDRLGVFIPLIVVNCIVLGRAEAYASKNDVLSSGIDGLSMGLGFTLALIIIGSVRELLGSGSLFGHEIYSGNGILLFILPPGAFLALAYVIVIINRIRKVS
jgi:electron transport complex protein RnfE